MADAYSLEKSSEHARPTWLRTLLFVMIGPVGIVSLIVTIAIARAAPDVADRVAFMAGRALPLLCLNGWLIEWKLRQGRGLFVVLAITCLVFVGLLSYIRGASVQRAHQPAPLVIQQEGAPSTRLY